MILSFCAGRSGSSSSFFVDHGQSPAAPFCARTKRAMHQVLRELETMVVDAWPAAETLERDGWLLRASGGPTHRGNSVATLDATGVIGLDARIDDAEAWYRERA